jgi:uncharacterized Zn finger protein
MSESVEARGRRLLTEGRLTVEKVDRDLAIASCRGDSGEIYRLGFDPRRWMWCCTCPARTRSSHLIALMLVVIRRDSEASQ